MMQREIERLGGKRPKLLLHSCCAPCSIPALRQLAESFELTVFYYNPNILSAAEFEKRLNALRILIASMPQKCEIEVPPYRHSEFTDAVRGFEACPEGGSRCKKCFELRLRRAGAKARSGGFEYLASTITTGPQKNARLVNSCGEAASSDAEVKWLPADFKKRGGYQKSVELSRELGLYRQDFCGCEFSKRDGK